MKNYLIFGWVVLGISIIFLGIDYLLSLFCSEIVGLGCLFPTHLILYPYYLLGSSFNFSASDLVNRFAGYIFSLVFLFGFGVVLGLIYDKIKKRSLNNGFNSSDSGGD